MMSLEPSATDNYQVSLKIRTEIRDIPFLDCCFKSASSEN